MNTFLSVWKKKTQYECPMLIQLAVSVLMSYLSVDQIYFYYIICIYPLDYICIFFERYKLESYYLFSQNLDS